MKKDQNSFLIILFFLMSFPFSVFAEWDNEIFKEGIETVQCHKAGFPLNPPFIQLGSVDKILFTFDDLNLEQSNYYYSIVHCDADWETSDIPLNIYMQGFNENEIYDADFSINTLQEYTHFSLELPNQYTEFLVSGNYIIKVFEDLDHTKMAISQRFIIYETTAKININVKVSSVVAKREIMQEVDFEVNIATLTVYNPFEEIKVVVMQNSRWDNAIYGLKPKFIKGNELNYDFEERSSFDGGNEYRNFDIKDFNHQSDQIAAILHDSDRVNIVLHPDEKRTFTRYSTWEDLNGNYLIKNDRAFNSETESDYAWVYFKIPFDFPLNDAKLFIGGLFSNYKFTDRYELKYDFDEQAYQTRIYVKQGYYNYAYFYLQNGEKAGQMDYIEGAHYQTKNDYTVIAYYKDSERMFYRVVAIQYALSHL